MFDSRQDFQSYKFSKVIYRQRKKVIRVPCRFQSGLWLYRRKNPNLQAQQYWHINHIFKRPSKLYTDNLVAVWEGEQVPEPPCVFPVVFCTNTACCGDC